MADGWQNNDSDRPIEEQEATTEMQMIDSGDPLFLFFAHTWQSANVIQT